MRSNLTSPLKYYIFLTSVLFLLTPRLFGQLDSSQRSAPGGQRLMNTLTTQACTGSLGDPIVNFTFGSGPNFGSPLAPGASTLQYIASTCPNDGYYTIASYTSGCFNNSWYEVKDHTGDGNGYFMLINASYDPSVFYVQQVDGLCSGTTYQFSAWIFNVLTNTAGIEPNITFSIEKTDGTVLQSYNSGNIPGGVPVWKQYGLYFTTPAGITSVVIRMKNNAPGGIGNDLALDDIAFRPAGPLTHISAAIPGDSINVCHSSVFLTTDVESCYLSNEYQWQVSVNNGNWVNIAGATNTYYTVPIQPAGKYRYRMLVSQSGNIMTTTCRVNSNTMTVVVVPDPEIQNIERSICKGQNYTLPSGTTVNSTGDYVDTARYAFGCDSLITHLHLNVQSAIVLDSNAVICEKTAFILPSGVSVFSSGTYRDTVRYRTGCDSLVRTIHLFVRPVAIRDSLLTICQGESVVLPWGATASVSGKYSDTIRYLAGCDSLIRNVYLHVTIPVFQSIERKICPGKTYTLPSGIMVSAPGIYRDTLRTALGCDSIITLLGLGPAPPPEIQLSKSNDITCTLGIARLSASGGSRFLWSPAESLNNKDIAGPVASPTVTTVYHVTVVTDLGCVGEDSILVTVSPEFTKNGLLLPNAFTPNNDGLNDCFGVRYLGNLSQLELSVYDRWGNRVFYTTNPSRCWDGTYKGKELNSGVFVYRISAMTLCGQVHKNGTVTLIR